jgi:tRNA pseudouridine55 synthase
MARRKRGQPISGWIILDKPAGLTSTAALARVRRLLDAQKAGHGGTLDPLATGLLPIALGEATKAIHAVFDGRKTYRFAVRWGEARDTDDAEGAVIATSPVRPSREQILSALPAFTGLVRQVPPDYSAIKVEGSRAYDLKRSGTDVTLASREVAVHRFALEACPDTDTAEFSVDCGKGTYIRALARDLALALGTVGHVVALRRTAVGPFRETDAITLEKLETLCDGAPPSGTVLPVETALADIPALAITGDEADRIRRGQAVRTPIARSGIVCVTAAGKPVALAIAENGEVRPTRVFNL